MRIAGVTILAAKFATAVRIDRPGNGRLRWLTTRFNSEREPRVKYSTLWPSPQGLAFGCDSGNATSLGPDRNQGGAEEGIACIRLLFA